MQVYQGGTSADTTNHEQIPGIGQPLSAPREASQLASHYDLVISHPRIEQDEFAVFGRWLSAAAADYDLNCANIHDGIIEETLRRLASGELTIGYHLDYAALWHVADDRYARLSFAVQDTGGRSVNLPARARAFTDKSAGHAELLRHGLGAPETVLVRPWRGDRSLSARELAQLKTDDSAGCLFVKPANGFAGRCVQRVVQPTAEKLQAALTAARQYDRQDALLVQRGVRWPKLRCDDGLERPAYWRVLSCLGELSAFWWSPLSETQGRPSYRAVTTNELRQQRLQPILGYVQALADISGLDWFSTELCLSEGDEASRFRVIGADGRERPVVAIDYFNDQCDVDVQSRVPGGVPDLYVWRLARRFAEEAWRLRQSKTQVPLRVSLRAA